MMQATLRPRGSRVRTDQVELRAATSTDVPVLATRLGDNGAGPRDLIDLHLGALENASPSVGSHGGAPIVEGRLLALEMMGLLVDYYRSGHRRRTTKGVGE